MTPQEAGDFYSRHLRDGAGRDRRRQLAVGVVTKCATEIVSIRG